MEKLENTIRLLRANNVRVENGLSEEEVKKAETFYNIVFPLDMKDFLKEVLPISKGFYNWRDYSPKNINHINLALQCPQEGILFDIENNAFWVEEWGAKPNDKEERESIVRKYMKKVPKLIPLFLHRYISSSPIKAGNPVYSVCQTDIIFYGEDLGDYFSVEFKEKEHRDIRFEKIREIPFWHDLVVSNYDK